MSNYITSSDITATVASDFNVSGYVDNTNTHIEYIAATFGYEPSEIADPIPLVLKEYAVAYCYRNMYLDKIGANNLDTTQDKYFTLYEIYNKEVERLRPYITEEIFDDSADTPNENIRQTVLFRN